jgi:fibro-slime domain-containing protein
VLWSFTSALCVSAFACGGKDEDGSNFKPVFASTGGSGPGLVVTGGTSSSSGGTSSTSGGRNGGVTTLPADYTKAEVGGYKLGAEFSGEAPQGAGNGTDDCNNLILAVVRDFKGANQGGHPDFETFSGDTITKNLVGPNLGADKKPVYASKCEGAGTTPACPEGQQTTSKANFDQWYRNTENVNRAFLINFFFAPNAGVFTFESQNFFPVDGAGFGNSGRGVDKQQHNFHFTTEVHTKFQYNGGETFKFIGDDDVWVYINGKLAMDIGGLHPTQQDQINLDAQASALGIQKGKTYDLDLFHAERHTDASRFRIDTNLAFVDCGTLPPEVIPK